MNKNPHRRRQGTGTAPVPTPPEIGGRPVESGGWGGPAPAKPNPTRASPHPQAIAPVPGRLTVVESVVHQPRGEDATSVTPSFQRHLTTEDQVYARRLAVAGDWAALDTGWLNGRCSQLVIVNESRRFDRQPTEGEREDAAARVLEVGTAAPGGTDPRPLILVRPGESCRFEPADANSLSLRCRHGEIRVKITAVPL